MVNISKTKRNFICWHTLFAVISAALGAVILHFAPAGALFRRVSVYTGLFLLLRVGQHLYVRRLPAARSAEIVTVVFGNEDDKDDSFADSGLDLLPCCTRRSQSFFTDVYLVLFDISDIRNLVFLLF